MVACVRYLSFFQKLIAKEPAISCVPSHRCALRCAANRYLSKGKTVRVRGRALLLVKCCTVLAVVTHCLKALRGTHFSLPRMSIIGKRMMGY